jgi:glycosyltransferase involved in cell wall biosynthesis
MKKLYVINSPSYVMNHSSHTCGQELDDDPLSEHFTYLYYNLAKFDLVDQVVIFPRVGPHDNFKDEIQDKIVIDDKKFITHNWNRSDMFDIINSDVNSFVYAWSQYESCKNLKKSYVLFNPVVANNTSNKLDKKFNHYALIEGMSHETHFSLVPSGVPIGVCPLTSKKFTELDVDVIQSTKKEYDWIMVSSFDPRKRHLEFLAQISSHPLFKELKGCIVARNPDNKGRINDGHYVYSQIRNSSYSKNIDIFLNVTNEKKIELLSKSKIFVCTSSLDFGPRATIEAIQAGLPILSSPHMGSCDWILPGKNGEIINNIVDAKTTLYEMLKKYDEGFYISEAKEMSQKIKPNSIYPQLVKDIKEKAEMHENIFQ